VWNFWHFAFIGSLATAATGSLGYGLVIAALMAALALLFADWSARAVQKFYGVPGVSVPHLASAQILPIAIVVNWIIDRIPGINKIDLSTETIERRLGVFGEPVVLGHNICRGCKHGDFQGIADRHDAGGRHVALAAHGEDSDGRPAAGIGSSA
jgi:galactitol-specific phosphotransferase system IIC component